MRARRPGSGQPLAASTRGPPGSSHGNGPDPGASLGPSQTQGVHSSSALPPGALPHAPAVGPRPTCSPSRSRPLRPRCRAWPPLTRGGSSVQRTGFASPTPRRSEGAGNGSSSMSILSSVPSGQLQTLDKGVHRCCAREWEPRRLRVAAASAPTAGRRLPGRWPRKPLLLATLRFP